jgi:hypothetical protein
LTYNTVPPSQYVNPHTINSNVDDHIDIDGDFGCSMAVWPDPARISDSGVLQ